jgi:tetratricopeptide (TPR) repeat protein
MTKTTTSVYRIFLSSTAIDLKDHRQKASDAIMRLGDLPVAMETFGALPNEPVEVCKNKVRECNALVVMVAHRYGWVPGTDEGGDGNKSITWIEVETALEAGKPVFAFLVDIKYGWTQPKEQDLLLKAKKKKEKDEVVKKVQALQDFRAFLDTKAGLTRETFTTPDDLAMKVSTSLSTWRRETISVPGIIPKQRTWVFRVVHPLQPAPHFRGRQNLLKDLQQWWEDPVHPDRVRSLVAIGGAGKTAVIERFLNGIQTDKLRGSILVWSFYEEPDTDAFLREACTVFAGEEGESAGGRLERLQRALSGSEPHLLVLDGLEKVQSVGKAGHARGDLEDHRVKNLLRSIASGLGRTRALITSRFKLTDLGQWEGAGYLSKQLDVLEKQAAVSVLEAWKVTGDYEQLQALAESVGRHALSVSVLGSYLNHFCNGDPKGAQEFNLEEVSADEPQAAKLGRILAEYAKNLPDEERDLLVRLSVFPRGVSVELLGYVIDAGGEIAGALVGIKRATLMRLAERLHKQGLVYTYKLRNCITYTAHPFLREYFRDLLGVPSEKIHEAVRSKLAIALDARPDTKPREAEMLDRYETLIEHSILAGRFQEAWDLYDNAMGGGGGRGHLYHILGDYGRIIRILSLFAKDGEPQHLAPQLSIGNRSSLINWWGLAAYSLGDLSTAKSCFDIASELWRSDRDWRNLSAGLGNSALVAETRAAFPSARKLLIKALEYVDADDRYGKRTSHSHLAATCHALGEISEAQENFAKATEILGQPLFSTDGIYEAEHLFALGNKKSAYELTNANLSTCKRAELIRDIFLCHTLLGLLSLPDSITEARKHLLKVRDWTDRSGHMECIIRAHILAAEIAYCAQDFAGALSEATTGLNHAEGCGYGKFAIELLLLLAKIHLAIPDPRTALGNARKALDRSQHPECCYAWGEANALHICGICHKELNEPELAKKRLKAAYKVRKRIQHPGAEETRKALDELRIS